MGFFHALGPSSSLSHGFLLSDTASPVTLGLISFLSGVASHQLDFWVHATSIQINLTGNHGAPREGISLVSTALFGLHACLFTVYTFHAGRFLRYEITPVSFWVHLTLGTAAFGGVRTSQAVFHALSFFWLDGFAVHCPSAGNAYRWAFPYKA
jgi:hypothetical protein